MEELVVHCRVCDIEESVDTGLERALVRAEKEKKQDKRCKDEEKGERRKKRGKHELFCEDISVGSGW